LYILPVYIQQNSVTQKRI